jgi:hypothetical protein
VTGEIQVKQLANGKLMENLFKNFHEAPREGTRPILQARSPDRAVFENTL